MWHRGNDPIAHGARAAWRRLAPPGDPAAGADVATTASPAAAPAHALARSPVLLGRAPDPADRRRVVAAVDVLRARAGVADAASFAAALGEFPARVGGLVAWLQEVLNVDGYPVLRYDRHARQVRLDVDQLAQQFALGAPGGAP